jgi:hypothetical protein
MIISRYLENQITKSLKPGHVVGLFGPRRSGKTFLMNLIIKKIKSNNILTVNGENMDAAEVLSSQRISVLERFVGKNKYLFVDEAQKIPKIGANLKLIVDSFPSVAVFVSGSSAFDLKNQIGEPLVGRSKYFYLYPFAQLELQEIEDYLKTKGDLASKLIYGTYPQVYLAESQSKKQEQVELIRDGYLLKDILSIDNLKDSLFIFNLLRLIAFQIGNDVSYSELASNLNTSAKTVMRYLELLEKSYILFSLHGFSKNLRKEYTKSPRYYFWDNGIRNSIISNYNKLHLRDDIGKLWENYLISERMKKGHYKKIYANRYFWRTYDQKEIDLVEERGGKLFGYEIKWATKKIKPPREFIKTYKNASFKVINQDNYLDFIS